MSTISRHSVQKTKVALNKQTQQRKGLKGIGYNFRS